MKRVAKSLLVPLSVVAALSAPVAAVDSGGRVFDDIRCKEYEFSPIDEGLVSAPNRAQDIRSTYTAGGVRIVPRTRTEPTWTVDLRLRRFGREARMTDLGRVTPVIEKGRVLFRRMGLVEWYANETKGLEQGFDLAAGPAGGAEQGRVVLEMAIAMSHLAVVAADRGTVVFKALDGRAALQYGGLRVSDATGRALDSSLDLSGDRLRIVFDDQGASYPVTIDPLLTSPSWTTTGGAASDNLGFSVAGAGDVNGDGYKDLLVGVPLYDGGETNEGRVFLYLGTSVGPVATSWVAEGNQVNAQFGYSVASAGDVNNDGKADVIIGAPFYDEGETDEGKVFIYHGQAAPPYLPATANETAQPNKAGWQFGYAVASAGKVNNDAYADVIVGAPGYENPNDNPLQTDEGRAYVFKGTANGTYTATAMWTSEGNQAYAFYGSSVASAGDVDNDGRDEVLVGCAFCDSGQENEGKVFMFMGGASNLGSSPGWTAESNQQGAFFGRSVAGVGDVNGDGYDDILIGADSYDNGEPDEGAAFVWYGASHFANTADGTPANASWMAESNQPGGAFGTCEFGSAVAGAGDVNGDSYDDILVGAYGYSSNGTTNNGSVFLWQGSSSGLGSNGYPGNADSQRNGESNVAWFGYSIAGAGDVDNDGFDDVIIGAPMQDGFYSDAGRAYLYGGGADGCSVRCQRTWCKFQDWLCTADCTGACCSYTNCGEAACNAESCPPNACSCQ